jgi:hypothetical protein
MDGSIKRKVVAGAVAGLAVAGGGAALAATQLSSPKEESQAVLNDAAKQLGIQPSALSDALKKALENRVDAAVAAGQLTKAQGDALKTRIESGELPLFFGYGHHEGRYAHGDELEAAASYLGLTEDQVRSELEGGKTLAQVATGHGKSVDGLVQALVDAETKELDAAVAAGRITKEQEQSILANLKQRVTDLVNGTGKGRFEHGFRPAFGFRGGPPAAFAGPTT